MARARLDNTFLDRLPAETLARLKPDMKPFRLVQGATIYEAGAVVDHVYFPTSGLLSQVNRAPNGQAIETAMIGVDGAGGVLESLGSGRAVWESMVQVEGEALRVSSKVIRDLARNDAAFMDACWRLVEIQTFETQQSVMCQALHTGEQRLSRWLLEAHERSGMRNPLPLTQEILATMLGVQRTTVTAIHLQLKQAGLIKGMRGNIRILDAAGLAGRACHCRSAVYARMTANSLQP